MGIYKFFKCIPEKIRNGIEDGETHTLRNIAEKFSVSPERIRQIEHKALRK